MNKPKRAEASCEATPPTQPDRCPDCGSVEKALRMCAKVHHHMIRTPHHTNTETCSPCVHSWHKGVPSPPQPLPPTRMLDRARKWLEKNIATVESDQVAHFMAGFANEEIARISPEPLAAKEAFQVILNIAQSHLDLGPCDSIANVAREALSRWAVAQPEQEKKS